MENTHKNRLVFWLMIFLIVFNVAALSTYYFRTNCSSRNKIGQPSSKQGITLSEELSLSKDQIKLVNEVNERFRRMNDPALASILEKKKALIDELAKPETDTAKIVKLAEEIGKAQGNIQLTNASQFLELKKICTPDQTLKLAEIYADLYGCQRDGKGKGHGNGQGRNRHRYGQTKNDTVN